MTSILSGDHPAILRYYPGDLSQDGSKLIDLSAAAEDGTATNVFEVAGTVGTAVSFSGSGSKVIIGEIGITNAVSLSLWVKPNSFPSSGRHVVFGFQDTVGSRYNLAITLETDGNFRIYCTFQNGTQLIDSFSRNSEAPHLIVSFNNGFVRVVQDNEVSLIYSGPVGGLGGQALNLILGADITNRGYFHGYLNRIRIANRPFTTAEERELYEEAFPYEISGLVKLDGSPLLTQVRLYNAATGALIETLNTDANGEYLTKLAASDPIYAMAIEPNGYRPLVHGPITPALRNL